MNVGRYTFDLFEGPVWAVEGLEDRELRFATVDDVPKLAILGVTPSQAEWIEAGSVCVWVAADDGSPGAMMWCHVGNHVDRYLGSWSRPGDGAVYVSGVATRSDLRGQGLARAILITGMLELSRHGIKTVRTATTPDNGASIAFHARAGLSRAGTLTGVRVGRFHLKRIKRL
jgi:GNAT superfamily N-acetyltransferase